MRRFTSLAVILSIITPICISAAPVPERKYAKPVIIKVESDQTARWVVVSVTHNAPYALLRETEEASRLAIVRRHLKDQTAEKEWKDFQDWVRKNLRFENDRDAKQVRVSFRDGTPEEQAAIINCAVDFYFKRDIDKRRETEMASLQRIRVMLSDPRAMIRDTPEQIAKYKMDLEKRHEEYMRTLPVLVEHAKAR